MINDVTRDYVVHLIETLYALHKVTSCHYAQLLYDTNQLSNPLLVTRRESYFVSYLILL